MSMVVWKFVPEPSADNTSATVEMPRGSRFLSAGPDPLGVYCLWALVDPEMPLTKRRVTLLATGEVVDEAPGRHMATVVSQDTGTVSHLFLEDEKRG